MKENKKIWFHFVDLLIQYSTKIGEFNKKTLYILLSLLCKNAYKAST